MRKRSVREIEKALTSKGFQKESGKKKEHHSFLYFIYNGRKTNVYTFLSHGAKSQDYGPELMSKIKRQLKFKETNDAENFFDCPFSQANYIDMLKSEKILY